MAYDNLYTKISEIVHKNENLDPIKLLKQIEQNENNIKQLDDEIKYFYDKSHCNKSDPDINTVVDDMLVNITDGRFKDLIDEEPVPLDPNSTCDITPAKRLEDLNFINSLLDNLKLNKAKYAEDESSIGDVKIPEQIGNITENLENLQTSLNQLKRNMANMVLHPSLNENTSRDVVFEANMMNVCQKINDFNKYFKAVEKMETICRETSESTETVNQNHHLPHAISALLKDVESVLLCDDLENERQE